MKGLYAAVALATLCAPSLAARFELSREPLPARTVPGKVIVELEPGSTIGARDGRDVDIHARFMEELDRRLPADSFRLRNKYDSAVFSGVALDLSSVEDIKTIAKTKGVKRVEPVRIIHQPPFKTTSAPDFKAAPDQFPPNIMTGVDKAHALGLTGKGIKIGIVDSGIDYTHPALGGGFGPGFKVAGGYDYTGDDGNSPDDDPLDQCGGHGTHVAGIIAADPNNPYNVTGVAYESTLYSYRVFGCNGETSTEIIMNAMIKAYEDGCDIITMSLGGPAGWSYEILSQVGTNIAKAGRVVTTAAGNDGQYGPWYTSSPATGTDVIAVGSVDNIALAPLWQLTTTVPEAATVLYQWDGGVLPLPVGDIALPAYFTSSDPAITNDACSALPASTPDLSGYVTFVRRGTCNFTIKIQNIVSKGGKVIIIMNGPGQPFAPINTGGYDSAALIQEADANVLLNAYLGGNQFTVSFPAAGDISFPPNLETGGLSSEFSSFGSSMDMLFKPAVSTPGGGILSTLPLTQNSYGIASGTSMATPHLAGISALLLQSKGKKIAKELRNLFETTATPIPVSHDEGAPRHTLAQAGAGLVNIANILAYETVLTPGELLLNDTLNWKSSHTIFIKNTGKTAKTYTITHVPAQTVITYDAATSQVNEYPVPTDDSSVTVRFSLSKATVLPGTTLPILVHIAAPTNPNADLLPIYSGQIEVSTDGETLRTSYLGAGKALKTVQVIDDTDWAIGVPFPLILDGAGNIQEEPTDYTLVNGDYPLFFYRLLFDSPIYTIDLVSADATLPKSANNKAKRGFFGDWISGAIGSWFPSIPTRSGSYAKVATVGRLFSYANEIRNDNYDYPYWSVDLLYDGTFANGTAVPLGSYKILARFLRVAGDASNQEDYESWLSPIVNIVAP